MKLLLCRTPSVGTYPLDSNRQVRRKPQRASSNMPDMSCNRARRMLRSNISNTAHKSSSVKSCLHQHYHEGSLRTVMYTVTWPSSALPRRQSPYCDVHGHLAFISTTKKAVSVLWCTRSPGLQQHYQEGSLRTVMYTVSRLEAITEAVGQQMVRKLIQHNRLKTLQRNCKSDTCR